MQDTTTIREQIAWHQIVVAQNDGPGGAERRIRIDNRKAILRLRRELKGAS